MHQGRCRQNVRAVRGEEPPDLRVVIPAGYVVEARLGVVVVSPVPQRVDLRAAAAGAQDIPPRIVLILCHNVAIRVHQLNDLPMGVEHIVIRGVTISAISRIPHRQRRPVRIVDEVQDRRSVALPYQLPAQGVVVVGHTIHHLAGPVASHVIGIAVGPGSALVDAAQLPTIDPGQSGERTPVIPVQGVPDSIIVDAPPLIPCQQIRPGVAVAGVSFILGIITFKAPRSGVE